MLETDKKVDVLIIGGGINGAGIAIDAASRGLSVVLCEQNDLASATSSASSKLIHGGLRYLEQLDFRLVYESLNEREILLAKAPHIIKPLRFILPHNKKLRPAWLIRLGLYLYDYLGNRKRLPASKSLDLEQSPYGKVLQGTSTKGFIYSDCWTDDARLVILNAMAAAEKGACIKNYARIVDVKRQENHWVATCIDTLTNIQQTIYARALINATGPWVNQVADNCLHIPSRQSLRLVKGSHIIVPRLYDHEAAYLLQNPDQRVVFVLPFGDYTIIGTTDVSYSGDPAHATIGDEEKNYLCNSVNQYFQRHILPKDIVWSYSGVRPLIDDRNKDPSKITRDYLIDLDNPINQAPLITVFGGKLTTYRKLAEQAVDKLRYYFPHCGPSLTATSVLPGGDIHESDVKAFFDQCQKIYPWLPKELLQHYVSNYGTRIHKLLNSIISMADLGRLFGAKLYQREVEYLIQQEWAKTAADILWRRTKFGLKFSAAETAQLTEWLANYFNP